MEDGDGGGKRGKEREKKERERVKDFDLISVFSMKFICCHFIIIYYYYYYYDSRLIFDLHKHFLACVRACVRACTRARVEPYNRVISDYSI